MRYFVDEEFLDNGETIDLISIGIVAEDGRELYLQSSAFHLFNASDWILSNVLPHLERCPYLATFHEQRELPTVFAGLDSDLRRHKFGQCVDQLYGIRHRCLWRTRSQLAHEVKTFMDPEQHGKPDLYGWCSAYDFVALCQLYGTMMDIPDGWPHYMHDLQHVLDERGITDEELPAQEEGLHNALEDAHHLKKLWGYIMRNDAWQ